MRCFPVTLPRFFLIIPFLDRLNTHVVKQAYDCVTLTDVRPKREAVKANYSRHPPLCAALEQCRPYQKKLTIDHSRWISCSCWTTSAKGLTLEPSNCGEVSPCLTARRSSTSQKAVADFTINSKSKFVKQATGDRVP
uniref:Putative secreted protein n=1 Tax=Amblyomma tuberculatum TaxID=48802 RepID=A0A6M2E3K1_9ACAR